MKTLTEQIVWMEGFLRECKDISNSYEDQAEAEEFISTVEDIIESLYRLSRI